MTAYLRRLFYRGEPDERIAVYLTRFNSPAPPRHQIIDNDPPQRWAWPIRQIERTSHETGMRI